MHQKVSGTILFAVGLILLLISQAKYMDLLIFGAISMLVGAWVVLRK